MFDDVIINAVFDRLTVIKRAGTDRWGKTCWRCVCDCGRKTRVVGRDLLTKNT
jgi:hypothetical protein